MLPFAAGIESTADQPVCAYRITAQRLNGASPLAFENNNNRICSAGDPARPRWYVPTAGQAGASNNPVLAEIFASFGLFFGHGFMNLL